MFSAHFYSTLSKDGSEEEVSRWVKNRHHSGFCQKFVLFPIHLDSHWSFLATINLLNINMVACVADNSDSTTELPELPILFHLDSAGGSRIRNWVMYQWKKDILIIRKCC
jgi:Ulp1 family protease